MQEQKNPTPSEEELDSLLNQFLEEEADNQPPAEDLDSMESINAKLEEFLTEAPEEAPPAPAESADNAPSALLEALPEQPEIGPDESALSGMDLTNPEDMEVDQIIQEAKAELFDPEQIQADEAILQEPEAPEVLPVPEEAAEEPEVEETEEVPEEEEPEEEFVLKRPPKKKNTYGFFGLTHVATTLIWLVITVAIGAALGRAIWLGASDVLAFGREDRTVTITITASDNMDTIADKLQKTGLIKYPGLYKLYIQLTGDVPSPGTYELSTLYDYHALANEMRSNSSTRVTVTVMIPEGYNCAQTFQLLQNKGVCTAAQLEEASMSADLSSYWFLEGLPRDHKYCLEGYLFPDTYEFYVGDDPARVLQKFLNNFKVKYTDLLSDKLAALNTTLASMMRQNGLSQDYIDDHQMTLKEVIIVASLIEREAATETERFTISSVIYNRLANPEDYPTLDIDATLIYITGRTDITAEDKLLDSPYNTYLHKGLPPGAICNPGSACINAALDPEATNYYFYALDPSTGSHHFSETEREHQEFLDSLKGA